MVLRQLSQHDGTGTFCTAATQGSQAAFVGCKGAVRGRR